MKVRWIVLACVMGSHFLVPLSMVPRASGQSLLERLEKKVRDGLELAPPKDVPKDSLNPQGKPDSGVAPIPPGQDEQLPSPAASKPPASKSIVESNSGAKLMPDPSAPQSLSSGQQSYLGLEVDPVIGGGIGARVATVADNSPAWRAGFRVNDVILAIDGYAIANLDSLADRLALRRPGDTIKVLVLRSGRNVELTAVLQNAAIAQRVQGFGNPAVPSPLTNPQGLGALSAQAWLGVIVADLSNAFRTQFGLGVYRAAAVTSVTKGSPADLVNIQPGDAIIAVDNRPIETARELLDWMNTKRPGDSVELSVMRGRRPVILQVTLATDSKSAIPNSLGSPQASARPPVTDPFANPPGGTELDTNRDNTVPGPVLTSSAEVERLREELKSTREQVSSLEQRIAELEKLIKR